MARVVADAGVPWVLMHWRGHSREMAAAAVYDDPVAEVRRELLDRVDAALAAGVDAGQVVLDPGFGFAKELPHDLALLAHLDAFVELGFPLLVGASRKRFLGRVLTGGDARVPTPAERDTATWPPRCWPRRPGRGPCGCTRWPPPWTSSAWSPPCGGGRPARLTGRPAVSPG